jgi:Tfp pilus assembly protein PilV
MRYLIAVAVAVVVVLIGLIPNAIAAYQDRKSRAQSEAARRARRKAAAVHAWADPEDFGDQ